MQVVVSEAGEDATGGKRTEMGRKALVPYGLYRGHGFYSPYFARATGADEQDLGILWEALQRMWDLDHSASRGLMSCRGLYVFSHDSALGKAPAHALFERITVSRREGRGAVTRAFADYEVRTDQAALPEGVVLTAVVGE